MRSTSRHRRLLLQGGGLIIACPSTVWSSTTQLAATPSQPQGPFYPHRFPDDTDNDLAQVRGIAQPAHGEVIHLIGRVMDTMGQLIPNASIEIWQCDANAHYHHHRDSPPSAWDPGFQGYGKTLSSHDGQYRFRTIFPLAYPGRTPHIHFAVRAEGLQLLITQMYVARVATNPHDHLFRSLSTRAQQQLLVDFDRLAPQAGARVGQFDLVLAPV